LLTFFFFWKTKVSANFGSKPFAFQASNAPPGDADALKKLREDQEAKIRELKQNEEAKLAAREAQAETLMGISFINDIIT
jgi:hypothetical protein